MTVHITKRCSRAHWGLGGKKGILLATQPGIEGGEEGQIQSLPE